MNRCGQCWAETLDPSPTDTASLLDVQSDLDDAYTRCGSLLSSSDCMAHRVGHTSLQVKAYDRTYDHVAGLAYELAYDAPSGSPSGGMSGGMYDAAYAVSYDYTNGSLDRRDYGRSLTGGQLATALAMAAGRHNDKRRCLLRLGATMVVVSDGPQSLMASGAPGGQTHRLGPRCRTAGAGRRRCTASGCGVSLHL